MAITIQSEPATITTASNPCEFEFSSTNTGQTAFSFLVELTINGSVVGYHQVFAESSNYGKFDPTEFLRSTVFSDLITDGTIQQPYTNAICSYSIRVREKYGDPVAEQGSWVSSNTVYAFNGSLRHVDWLSFNYTDYDVSSTNDSLLLTSFPRTSTYFCALTESQFVGTLVSNNLQTNIYVDLYDVNGSLIASDNMASTSLSRLIVADVSPQTIIDQMTITTSDFADCYYYEVQFRNISTGYQTEEFRIYIDTECSQYTSRRLHWLNKFGVWDSYSFTKHSEESTNVQSRGFETSKGNWNDSNQFVYNREDGQSKTFAKTSTDKLTINSNWIKEEKHNWLMRSLMESPKVYLEVSQGVFELVNVATSRYTLKKRIKEGLIQESIVLNKTYNYTSQLA